MTDETMLDVTALRVTVDQVRVAADATSRDFAAVAETLRPDGDVRDTARRMIELGTTLRTFGELLERYWTQNLTEDLPVVRTCVEFRADVVGDMETCMRCRRHRSEHGRGARRV